MMVILVIMLLEAYRNVMHISALDVVYSLESYSLVLLSMQVRIGHKR